MEASSQINTWSTQTWGLSIANGTPSAVSFYSWIPPCHMTLMKKSVSGCGAPRLICFFCLIHPCLECMCTPLSECSLEAKTVIK